MMRSCRSDVRVAISSWMIFGTVSAVERTAPVHGEQPSDRMRHITFCGFSPSRSGDEPLLGDDQGIAAHDDLTLLGEVERHDRNLLGVDVVPHVDLGPVGEREHADALAGIEAAVQQVPELRALALRVPLALVVAQREDAFLRARPLLVAPRAAERRVEVAGLERVEQRARLEQPAAALRAEHERLCALVDRPLVGVDDQPGADLGRVAVAELDHLAELVGGVDVQQRERNRARDRTPSAPAAAGPRSPCRSSRASPAARTPPRPRA